VEISNINLTLPAVAREFGQNEIHIQQGKKLFEGVSYGNRAPWHNYYRYIGYFQKNEFDGWTFPHYGRTGEEIEEWWNPDRIFSIEQGYRIPLPGAYPMIYKIDNEDWQKAPVTIGVYQQDQGMDKQMPVTANMEGAYPYAVYKKKIAAGNGDYLCIDGSIIGSMCTLNDIHRSSKDKKLFLWPRFALGNNSRGEWEAAGNFFDHYSWRVCPCPLVCESGSDADEDDDDTWDIFNSCWWLRASVRFGNLYWSDNKKSWDPVFGAFNIKTGKKKEKKGDLNISTALSDRKTDR
jgi:hypothetical protein